MAFEIRHIVFAAILQVSLSSVSSCPNGWIRHGNSCYHFSHDLEPWTGALAMCHVMGGKLLEIESAAENAYIATVTSSRNHAYWTGLSDIQEEGIWIWMESNLKLSSNVYTNWSSGEPNNDDGNGNCGNIFPNGHWYDWHCKDDLHYICEQPLE
ncbi:perlucin-like protein [Mercenaria mercenaria]|uniref:perlucin-like protein n=1 Tax=Mercenaria mercenaria TaxID=6596 RepID=UPI00234E90A1|nr:perlucin-like protein [Mercenaria mercenaria]